MQIFSFKFLVLSCIKLFILISTTVGKNSVFLSEIQIKKIPPKLSIQFTLTNMPLLNITVAQQLCPSDALEIRRMTTFYEITNRCSYM